jgi:hypothetical protein
MVLDQSLDEQAMIGDLSMGDDPQIQEIGVA